MFDWVHALNERNDAPAATPALTRERGPSGFFSFPFFFNLHARFPSVLFAPLSRPLSHPLSLLFHRKRTHPPTPWTARSAASTCRPRTWAGWRWRRPRGSSARGARRPRKRRIRGVAGVAPPRVARQEGRRASESVYPEHESAVSLKARPRDKGTGRGREGRRRRGALTFVRRRSLTLHFFICFQPRPALPHSTPLSISTMPRQQWSVVTSPATAGAGPTYRHVSAKDGFPTLDGVSTLHELFDRARTKFADSPCLGWRPIVRKRVGGRDGGGVRR